MICNIIEKDSLLTVMTSPTSKFLIMTSLPPATMNLTPVKLTNRYFH